MIASLGILFLVVFALNGLPAFAPPTWMAMSFFGLRYPGMHTAVVALVAASGATCGRALLAHFAGRIVRGRFVSDAMRENLAGVANIIPRRRSASVAVFLVFAFSPLPSNALFLAYGLTRAPLRLLVIPFFIGRLVSYAGALAGGAIVSRHLESQMAAARTWFWACFVLAQVALLCLVYIFAKVDWCRSALERRLCWISTPKHCAAANKPTSSED